MKTIHASYYIKSGILALLILSTGKLVTAQVSAGYDFYLASCDGNMAAWGEGSWGTLGDGQVESNMIPVTVEGLSDIVQFSSCMNFNLAVKSDGTLWSWGGNQHGQLGLGDTDSRSVPTMVSGIPQIVDVHAGRWWGMALTTDGKVYAWGRGDAGSLGNGDFSDVLAPVEIAGLSNVVQIHGGYANGFAILNSGEVMCWGYNEWNCMGFSTWPSSVVPTPVVSPFPGQVKSISGGYWNTIAILADSTLVAAGTNNFGQLALGSMNMTFSWVPIPNLNKIVQVNCGSSHCLAIDDTGKLYTWGYNSYGQVGNGNNENQLTPYEHTGLEPVLWAAGGERQSIIQTASGNIYTFGHVVAGTFENGQLIHSNLPTLIDTDVCNSLSARTDVDDASLQVYPNPANGSVVIIQDGDRQGTLRVSDITGRFVFSSTVISKSTMLDLSHLNSGIYVLQLESDGKVYTTKLFLN